MPKKNMPKKNIKKTKKNTPPPIPKSLISELTAILLFLIALFVHVCNISPASTGLIGFWIISIGAKNLIGATTTYLPLFLGMAACSLILPFSRKKPALLTLSVCFLSFTIFLELITNKVVPSLVWPSPTDGGGIIGHYGLFLLQQVIGYHGTWIFLGGVLLTTIILVFNFSFINAGRFLIKTLFFNKKGHKKKATTSPLKLLTLLKYILFYEKKSLDLAYETPSTASTLVKEKPEIKGGKNKPFKLPEFDDSPETQEPIIDEPIPEDDVSETILPLFSNKKGKKRITISDEEFSLPPLKLLTPGKKSSLNSKEAQEKRQEQARVLEETLASFNVKAHVVNITPGPSVTRFELQPGVGVKISKITSLSQDIALKLAALDVRIEAPIPGKALVGIEVPNAITDTITLRMLLTNDDFYNPPSKLLSGMGLTINGNAVYMDLGKMPHVLIAGATGSGKSVCINAIILSILMKSTPNDVKFLMIDPKKVELSLYEGIPHLVAPVVTNPHKAAATLKEWALLEMETRYDNFAAIGVKDITGYNNKMLDLQDSLKKDPEKTQKEIRSLFSLEEVEDDEEPINYAEKIKKLPYLVVIIDELADLMMVASQEVENTICRLAQMARATGIHLVIATQRPSVNVVTGLIKANVPSRVSFFLQSQIDSRTIIDTPGAEKLLGKGDMLYMPVGAFKPQRLQGVFVSEPEVKGVVKFLKQQGSPDYDKAIEEIQPLPESGEKEGSSGESDDDMYDQAKELVKNTQYASTSYLQRKLRIGYNRAARLMDELEENGVISPFDGEKKSRTVL